MSNTAAAGKIFFTNLTANLRTSNFGGLVYVLTALKQAADWNSPGKKKRSVNQN